MKTIQTLIASVFLFACSDLNRPGQLERIDDLLFELDEIQNATDRSGLDTIPIVLVEVERIEYAIKQNYINDTLSLDFAKKLDSYKRIRQNLNPLKEIGPVLLEKIHFERNAINNLREDVLYCTGDRAKYEENIAIETETVNDLRHMVEQCIATKEENVETFNTLHNDLRSYSLMLVDKNKER